MTTEQIGKWPFRIVDEDSKLKIEIEHETESVTYSPEEIIACLLRDLKKKAESHLKVDNVTNVVISIPSGWEESRGRR